MNVLIFEQDEIHKEAIDLLIKNNHTIFYPTNKYNSESINAIFVRTYTRVDKKMLKIFPNCKYILRAGVGMENIDAKECNKRDIKLINAPASNANAVSEFVVGLMIILLHKIQQQQISLYKGEWRKKEFAGRELINKTIGFVGCGAIGELIIKKLKSFEIKKIISYDPYLSRNKLHMRGAEKVGLLQLLRKSDVISLHLPLNDETRNLISRKNLCYIKNTGYLINTSRGGIINEIDLIDALEKKIIQGAALDVFEFEPKIRKDLLKMDNLFITPHIAGYTKEADKQMAVMPVKTFLSIAE